jgi:hypothetical protein
MQRSVDEERRMHAERRDRRGVPTRQPDFELRQSEMFAQLASENRQSQLAALGGAVPVLEATFPSFVAGPAGDSRRRYRRGVVCDAKALHVAEKEEEELLEGELRKRKEMRSGGGRAPWLSPKVLIVVFAVLISNLRRVLVLVQALTEFFTEKSHVGPVTV